MTVTLEKVDDGVSCIEISDLAVEQDGRPTFDRYRIRIHAEKPVEAVVSLRAPWWLDGPMTCTRDGKDVSAAPEAGYLRLDGVWQDSELTVTLPRGLHSWPLADEPDTVAFLDGPEVLAGLVDDERILFGDKDRPETMLTPHNERIWGSWTREYRTRGQQHGFRLRPLREIGKERYTVYFPIEKTKPV